MLGEEEILKVLLDNGVDVNHQDKMGRSALYVGNEYVISYFEVVQ
jgi:hypothetical protein